MNCFYCPEPADFLATACDMTRLACRSDVDRARRDCSAVGPATVTEVGAQDTVTAAAQLPYVRIVDFIPGRAA